MKLFKGLFVGIAAVTLTTIGMQTASAQFNPIDEACRGRAASSDVCQSQSPNENPVSGSDGVIIRIVNILAILGGIIAVIIMMVAGIKMILSGGDANRVKNSRETIIYAAVGIVVIVVSRSIIIFIINKT